MVKYNQNCTLILNTKYNSTIKVDGIEFRSILTVWTSVSKSDYYCFQSNDHDGWKYLSLMSV